MQMIAIKDHVQMLPCLMLCHAPLLLAIIFSNPCNVVNLLSDMAAMASVGQRGMSLQSVLGNKSDEIKQLGLRVC